MDSIRTKLSNISRDRWVSIVLLLVCIVLIYMLVMCKKSESFCLSSSAFGLGHRFRACNLGVTKKQYNAGLTEYSDMDKLNPPRWSTVSPGDMNFPNAYNANWDFQQKMEDVV